jgi:hypothetical protein
LELNREITVCSTAALPSVCKLQLKNTGSAISEC